MEIGDWRGVLLSKTKHQQLQKCWCRSPSPSSFLNVTCWTLIALVQSGLGHHLKIMNQHLQSCILIPHLIVLLHCTKLSVISC